MPSLTKGVGIVSNITYKDTNLERNFDRGLDHPQWDRVVLHQVGYDPAHLAEAVGRLNDNPSVGLIVTVGGVTTAQAALSYPQLTKPFVSLIGDIIIPDFPGTIQGRFFGGINLENFRRNSERIARLGARGFAAHEICLLCNPMSATTRLETEEWRNANPPRGDIFDAQNLQKIQEAFTKFKQHDTLRAMIISSDGFFQDSKDLIKDEAEKSRKLVCYPLQIYAEGNRPLPRGRSRRHGPRLATAYFDLGRKAAEVIQSGTASTLDSATTSEIKDD
jgi:hypothetical protein